MSQTIYLRHLLCDRLKELYVKVIMEPLTGRRHQLRIHCHSLGHTILGDYTYSDRSDTKPKRMYLHAYKIDLPNTLEGLLWSVCQMTKSLT